MHSRPCRCKRLHQSSQRWRSAAGGLRTESSLVGPPSAQNLKRIKSQVRHESYHPDNLSCDRHTLTILPPGEARGRYATGLTHQSGEASLDHSQGRHLL